MRPYFEGMEAIEYQEALSALAWQIELGADEAILDQPINRFDEPDKRPKLKFGAGSNIAPVSIEVAAPPAQAAPDIARIMAQKCDDLEALRNAMGVFELCSLKQGARNLVFSDGKVGARVMIIGEAPGRDEDVEGKPFVGRAGQLLDKMFAAIDMGRERNGDHGLYITNVMPWRPPQNRDPEPEEIEMMLPFLQRHIALVQPSILVLMGNTACRAVLGKTGITKMRGNWAKAFDLPVMPMFHPAALLRDPLKKRDAWSDLLQIKARLTDEH